MISVIVPVFRVEAYLTECVESILNQSFRDFECILVDDGSPDGCPAMCDAFARQDSRVRVIHRKNGGLSAARNTGLDAAKGEYITFVDSDDVLQPQFLEILLGLLERNHADLSLCGYQRFRDVPLAVSSEGKERVMTGLEALAELNQWRSEEATGMVVAWMKLYKRCLFDELRFRPGVLHEDEFLTHHILYQCRTVARTSAQLYGYRLNPQSIMGTGASGIGFEHLILMDALSERIAFFSEKVPVLVSGAVHHLLRECNSFYDDYSKQEGKAFREKQTLLVQIYRRQYLRFWSMLDWKERLKGGLFAFCPSLYHSMAEQKWNKRVL